MRTFFNVLYWTMRVIGWAILIGGISLCGYLIYSAIAPDPEAFGIVALAVAAVIAIIGVLSWVYSYAEERRHG